MLASEPLEVEIPDRVVWASCGGRHTVAVTGECLVFGFAVGKHTLYGKDVGLCMSCCTV